MKNKKLFIEALSMLTLLTRLGLTMALPIMICTYMGRRIDATLNTTPVFILVFLFFGIVGAFSLMNKELKVFTEKRK